jgi:hypothetical protein
MSTPHLKEERDTLSPISTPTHTTAYGKTEATETLSEKNNRLIGHSTVAMLHLALQYFQQMLNQFPIIQAFTKQATTITLDDDEDATDSTPAQALTKRNDALEKLEKELKELHTHFDSLLTVTETLVTTLQTAVNARDPNNPNAQIEFTGHAAFAGLNRAHTWPRPGQSRSYTADELKEVMSIARQHITQHLGMIRSANAVLQQHHRPNTDSETRAAAFEERVDRLIQGIEDILRALDNPTIQADSSADDSLSIGSTQEDPPPRYSP